jgi:hypothetical protein
MKKFFLQIMSKKATKGLNDEMDRLSHYSDIRTKKKITNMLEDDVEMTLEKVMTLFRYLQEKDMFEMYSNPRLPRSFFHFTC